MRKGLLHIVLLTALFLPIKSQITRDSLLHSPYNFAGKGINSSFEKRLNIYTLKSVINYNLSLKNIFFGIKEDYGSTIVQSSNKNIRDEHYLSFLGEYKFSPYINLGVTFNNDIYADNRSLAINQVSITQSTLYSRISPYNRINIIPFAGFSRNKQIGEMDEGYFYGAEFGIDSLTITDFDLSTTARFSNEDIFPRRNLDRIATVSISNKYENSIMNRFSASYNELKKDFYFATDSSTQTYFDITNNIQSRSEKNYFIQDQLIMLPDNSNFLFLLFGRIDWRDIDRNTRYVNPESISTNSFDTKIEEYRINFISSLQYNYKSFSAQLRISYLEHEEKHFAKKIEAINRVFYERRSELEYQKNNKSQQTTLSLSGQYRLSSNDLISGSILHRKILYNTPSESNYDDRDELLTIFRLEYTRNLNSLMNVFVKIDGSINHLVYIFGERSSNNNIRRVLALTGGSSFYGQRVKNVTTASVMADYTVYDFTEYNPYLKNFSFRRFVVTDSSSLKLNRDFSLNLEGYVRLSEQGDFSWINFSSHPSRFLEEVYAEPKIKFSREKYSFAAGVKYFSLSTYGYNKTEKVKQSEYKSLGPMSEIIINTSENLNLAFRMWYEFIKSENDINQENINFNLRFVWNL